jgi:hypothetical protein
MKHYRLHFHKKISFQEAIVECRLCNGKLKCLESSWYCNTALSIRKSRSLVYSALMDVQTKSNEQM